MRRKTKETCEMCSSEVDNPSTIKVEGALLRVCHRCTSFGNIVRERPATQNKTGVRTVKSNNIKVNKPSTQVKRNPRQERELMSNFASEIRLSRQKKKFSHEKLSALTGITVATLKSIESGKMRPTDRDAKKIERELSVDLFIDMEMELEYQEKKRKKATTLGDIAVIKHYDYDQD